MTEPLIPTWDGRPNERQLLAFVTRVLDEHEAPLLRLAFALTGDWPAAQDIVQDALLALCHVLLRGDAIADAGAWLRATVRHKAIDHVRRAALEREKLAKLQPDEADGKADPAVQAEQAELSRLVRRQMADLPERERLVLQLSFFEHRTCDEIAQALGLDPRSVRRLRTRGVARLTAILALEPPASEPAP